METSSRDAFAFMTPFCRSFLATAALCSVLFACQPSLHATTYSAYCRPCEEHIGGNSRIGPMSSLAECEEWRRKSLDNNYPYTPCEADPGSDTGGSSSSAGDSSLQDSTTQALSYGLAHGDSETFGLGVMGLGVMALTSAPSGPSPAEQAAQQQAERERIDRYNAEQAAKRQRFEADKSEMLGDLKGEGRASDKPEDFGLKGDDSDGLKDSPAPKRKKKPFHPPHLKAVANPLYKDPQPGDSTGSTEFNDWEQAKTFARANGGTLGREDSGKIVWCTKGFPYACGGHCYSEDAFEDFRIPCNSKLHTTEP